VVQDATGSSNNIKIGRIKVIPYAPENIRLIQGFSPNGDGINDRLLFKGIENYPKSSLHIYNRSGQLVYQSTNYQNDWDGTMPGGQRKVQTGVYYYILDLGPDKQKIKGYLYIGY
jgi:gliding motility-associated-like protein